MSHANPYMPNYDSVVKVTGTRNNLGEGTLAVREDPRQFHYPLMEHDHWSVLYTWSVLYAEVSIYHQTRDNCPTWTNQECRCMVEPL